MRGAAGGAAEPQNRASQRRIGLFRGQHPEKLFGLYTGLSEPLRKIIGIRGFGVGIFRHRGQPE